MKKTIQEIAKGVLIRLIVIFLVFLLAKAAGSFDIKIPLMLLTEVVDERHGGQSPD